MTFDKFRKFRPTGGETRVETPKNPYVRKALGITAEPEIDTSDLGEFDLSGKQKEQALLKTSLLDGQNKHLFTQILVLQRQMKEMMENFGSIYSMIMEPDGVDEMTNEEARERYMEFRKDLRHLINRKTNKTE